MPGYNQDRPWISSNAF